MSKLDNVLIKIVIIVWAVIFVVYIYDTCKDYEEGVFNNMANDFN